MRAPAGVIEAALILADELEEDGYLRVPLAEVASRHRLRAADALAGLRLVQACDPAGVGARDLRECLALQLAERDRLDPAMQAMLDNLALAARGRLGELRRAAASTPRTSPTCWPSCARSTRSRACASPATPVQSAVPDVHVRRAPEGGWTRGAQHRDPAARADEQRLRRPRARPRRRHPRLHLGMQRQRQLAGAQPGAAGAHHPQGGDRDRRAPGPLLQRRGLASSGRSPSARSPASSGCTNRPSAASRRGNTSHAIRDASISASSSARRSRRSPAARPSPPRPCRSGSAASCRPSGGRRSLSDDKIVALLKDEGIDIARRTVAKYREGMGIPSSVERRRLRNDLSAP